MPLVFPSLFRYIYFRFLIFVFQEGQSRFKYTFQILPGTTSPFIEPFGQTSCSLRISFRAVCDKHHVTVVSTSRWILNLRTRSYFFSLEKIKIALPSVGAVWKILQDFCIQETVQLYDINLFYDGLSQVSLDCEILKMKLLHSVETTVNIYQTTRLPDVLKYLGLRHDHCRTSAVTNISFLKRIRLHRLI